MPLQHYCPNCGEAVSATAQSCSNCDATFGENSAWKPLEKVPTKNQPLGGRMLLRAGVFITLALPLFAALGYGIWTLMPGCTGGSGGPPSGCVLFGIGLNWLISLTILAFLGSFFSVPLGLLVMAIAAIARVFRTK